MLPSNAFRNSINDLILELQKLPPNTTYEVLDEELHGWECVIQGKLFGTTYQKTIAFCLGTNQDHKND